MYITVGDDSHRTSQCRELVVEKQCRWVRGIRRASPDKSVDATADIYGILLHKRGNCHQSYQPGRFKGMHITEEYRLDKYMSRLIGLVYKIIPLCKRDSDGKRILGELINRNQGNTLSSICKREPDGVDDLLYGTLLDIPTDWLTRNYLTSFLLQLVRFWGDLHLRKQRGVDLTPLFFTTRARFNEDFGLGDVGGALFNAITHQYMLPLGLCAYNDSSFWATLHLLINYAEMQKVLPRDARSSGFRSYFALYGKRIEHSTREYYTKLQQGGVFTTRNFLLRW